MNGCVKFHFREKSKTEAVVVTSVMLQIFYDLLMHKVLTCCHVPLHEICMADARQQDVKEEDEGLLGKVKGRSHHHQES